MARYHPVQQIFYTAAGGSIHPHIARMTSRASYD
jgi:hypothetical protein